MAEISLKNYLKIIRNRRDGVKTHLDRVNKITDSEPFQSDYLDKKSYNKDRANFMITQETGRFFTKFGQTPFLTVDQFDKDTPVASDSQSAEGLKAKYIDLYQKYVEAKYELEETIINELKVDLVKSLFENEDLTRFEDEIRLVVNNLPRYSKKITEKIKTVSGGTISKETFNLEIPILIDFLYKKQISEEVKIQIIQRIKNYYQKIENRQNAVKQKLQVFKEFVNKRKIIINETQQKLKQQEIKSNNSEKRQEINIVSDLLVFNLEEELGLNSFGLKIVLSFLNDYKRFYWDCNNRDVFSTNGMAQNKRGYSSAENFAMSQIMTDQYCKVERSVEFSKQPLLEFSKEITKNFFIRNITRLKDQYLQKIVGVEENYNSEDKLELKKLIEFLQNSPDEKIVEFIIQKNEILDTRYSYDSFRYFCDDIFSKFLIEKSLDKFIPNIRRQNSTSFETDISSLILIPPELWIETGELNGLRPKSFEESNEHLKNGKWLISITDLGEYWQKVLDVCESKINIKIPEVTHRIKNWYPDRKKIDKDFKFSGCNLAEARSKAKELEEQNNIQYQEVKKSGRENLTQVLGEYYHESVIINLVDNKIRICGDYFAQTQEDSLANQIDQKPKSKLIPDRSDFQNFLNNLKTDLDTENGNSPNSLDILTNILTVTNQINQINIFDNDLLNIQLQLKKIATNLEIELQKLQEKDNNSASNSIKKLFGRFKSDEEKPKKSEKQTLIDKLRNLISDLKDRIDYLENLQNPKTIYQNSDFLAFKNLEIYLQTPEITTKIQSQFPNNSQSKLGIKTSISALIKFLSGQTNSL